MGDWMYPVLAGRTSMQRVLSVHIEPLPPWKAVRRAEHASTNAASEMRRRSQFGFEGRMRDVRGLEAITSREDELASGHAGVKITGTITVSAVGQEALLMSEHDAQDTAAQSRLQLRKLYGRENDGLTSALPICTPVHNAMMHETTTRHAASLWPCQITPGLDVPGAVIGLDALSGSVFSYDPFRLYEAGVIRSPNMVVLGIIGNGKSAFIKSYLYRQATIFNRRIWVAADPKGEYIALAHALDLPVISLRPGGQVRLNPLDIGGERDSDTATTRRVNLLATLSAAQLGRKLAPEELSALNAAVHQLQGMSEPVLGDVVNLLFHPTAEMYEALGVTEAEFITMARQMTFELNRLLTGDLAGMFDGRSTVDTSGNRGGVIDLSAVYEHHSALVPTMICAAQWITSQLAARDGVQTMLVLDEAWQALGAAGVTEWMQSTTKLARSFGVSVITILHHISDLATVGDSQAAVERARGLLRDSDTVVTFAQPPDEIGVMRAALGITDREAELIGEFGRGRTLWMVKQHHTIVDVVLTEHERTITDTDTAMGGR